MKDIVMSQVNKLLRDPRVMICLAKGIDYTLEPINDVEGHPAGFTFKTKNKVRFIFDESKNVINVEEKL